MEIRLLNQINTPQDLKKLDSALLPELCAEIRLVLIDTISRNGGHLASNLGAVELTVALHRSFNAPDDRIVWDVGHQAYTHKLLTGRYTGISTIRTSHGLSGFPRPDESVYDTFYEGHAGTSVSQASGVAAALTLKGSKNYSVAVIGDGSFSNGLVYEALNAAGMTKNRLVIVLNDNEMSISKNVGAMAKYLAKVRSKPEYYRLKAGTEKALNRIPVVGKKLSAHIFRLKTALKNILYSSSFFEDLGIRYTGPFDGHDIASLCDAFEGAKMVNGPVVVHVHTKKGKGYEYAENNPDRFHGVGSFDVENGLSKQAGPNFSSEFGSALCSFASNDRRICAVTAAMALGTGLDGFSEQFPDRFFDVGIAEEHAVTFCSGLSAGGMIPVFAVYSTFLQRCFDQLIHDCALQRTKNIIAVDRAGFVGEDGETHQGLYDVPMLSCVPGITVYAPSFYSEISGALYHAFYKDAGTVAIRYPRGREDYPFEGEFSDYGIHGDESSPVTLVTYGRLFTQAVACADELRKKGITLRIIKLTRIVPLPAEAVLEAMKSEMVFFFEEGIRSGGIGEKFSSALMEKGFRGRFFLTAVDNCFVRHAPVAELLSEFGLDSSGMCRKIINSIVKEGESVER